LHHALIGIADTGIGVIKPDGSGERLLIDSFHNEVPTWASNGRVLMFFRDHGGNTRFLMIAGAPTPVGPFSHAVEVDGWVFLTGQMPTDPENERAQLPAGIEAQTRRVMDNLILVLRGLGLGLLHVVAVRVF
jgi:Endoribonuclease L-PSP